MRFYKKLNRIGLFVVVMVLTAVFASAQTNDESPSRSITSQDFQTKRPAANRGGAKKSLSKKAIIPSTNQKRRKNIAVVANPGRRYKFVKRTTVPKTRVLASTTLKASPQKSKITKSSIEAETQDEELGVTFWKLRPLKKSEEEDAPTFKVNTGDGYEDWTAERVSSSTKFKPGDRVRFTIEPLRSGFIYILNREVYKDGTTGKTLLIHPDFAGRTRRDVSVNAGRLVEIPATSEDIPYFLIGTDEEKYSGEEIIVVISPTKLSGFNFGKDEILVQPSLIEKWFNEWASSTDAYDASDGEGVAYTRTEAEAVKTRSLTQEEPLPQTIYRFKSVAGKPLMISFQLQIKQK